MSYRIPLNPNCFLTFSNILFWECNFISQKAYFCGMNTTSKHISAFIKRVRIGKNITQSEMAEKLGMTLKNYQRIEYNHLKLDIDKRLIKIAEILDLSLCEILDVVYGFKDPALSPAYQVSTLVSESYSNFYELIRYNIDNAHSIFDAAHTEVKADKSIKPAISKIMQDTETALKNVDKILSLLEPEVDSISAYSDSMDNHSKHYPTLVSLKKYFKENDSGETEE